MPPTCSVHGGVLWAGRISSCGNRYDSHLRPHVSSYKDARCQALLGITISCWGKSLDSHLNGSPLAPCSSLHAQGGLLSRLGDANT